MFFQFDKDSHLSIEMQEINAVVLDWGPWTRGICITILGHHSGPAQSEMLRVGPSSQCQQTLQVVILF